MARFSKALAVPLAAALMVAGCATTPTAEVTRFHLNQPIPKDTLTVVPATGIDPASLEFRSYAEDVSRQFAALGFPPAPVPAKSAYVVTINATQSSGVAPPTSSPVSIGFGGATGGSGFGMGGGVSVPVGGSGAKMINNNQVALQMKRRSDNSIVWEGRAVAAGAVQCRQRLAGRFGAAADQPVAEGLPRPFGPDRHRQAAGRHTDDPHRFGL